MASCTAPRQVSHTDITDPLPQKVAGPFWDAWDDCSGLLTNQLLAALRTASYDYEQQTDSTKT
jgi:hypothetical protein